MIPETENPQKAKSEYPGKPARHADTLRNVNFVGFLSRRLICFIDDIMLYGAFNSVSLI